MKAINCVEGKIYSIPSRGLKSVEFYGTDPLKTFCRFFMFDEYGERKVLMVSNVSEVVEESN